MVDDQQSPAGDNLSDEAGHRVLERFLEIAPFEGWSRSSLLAAGREAGLSAQEVRALFPEGAGSAFLMFTADMDRRTEDALAETDLSGLRIRDRIATLVLTRLDVMAPYRAAAHQAARFSVMPQNAAISTRSLARTSDKLWRLAGDTSTDFNFYTKRGILGGVFGRTLLTWLEDEDPEMGATRKTLDVQIGRVMEFEKFKARFRTMQPDSDLPARILAAFRYPNIRRPGSGTGRPHPREGL